MRSWHPSVFRRQRWCVCTHGYTCIQGQLKLNKGEGMFRVNKFIVSRVWHFKTEKSDKEENMYYITLFTKFVTPAWVRNIIYYINLMCVHDWGDGWVWMDGWMDGWMDMRVHGSNYGCRKNAITRIYTYCHPCVYTNNISASKKQLRPYVTMSEHPALNIHYIYIYLFSAMSTNINDIFLFMSAYTAVQIVEPMTAQS